jgi:predicted  nucleic acid-binding Zn-ribbon protein
MTNEELFTDLKQFIEATVSQHVGHLDHRLDSVEQHLDGVDQRLTGVEHRLDAIETTMATKADLELIDEKLNAIQDAIGESFAQSDATMQDHEQRLRRLEHKTA